MDLNLHLFYSNGLIAKFLPSQSNIPYNLCLFNIGEFALKEGANNNIIILNPSFYMACVATLALGSRPRQRGCKGAGQEEARESHQRLPGV
jgi:hypothetical protein